MKLMSFEVLRAKARERKLRQGNNSKRVEQRLLLELKKVLEEELRYNDRTMIEVNPKVVGQFLNILSDKFLTIYEYEQYDKNKFIFYTKEISI